MISYLGQLHNVIRMYIQILRMFMRTVIVVLSLLVTDSLCNTECIWATGRLQCNRDQSRVRNAVVEVWDKDGPREIGAVDSLDADDMAGLSVVDNDDGLFKVEGCASDIDWLGPLHRNRPEFYFKIRHRCKSDAWTEITVFPPRDVYAPVTMDHFMENPIALD